MKISSRSWPSVTVPQYAKPFKILVWKNGDFDSNEQEVTINPKYVKSWTATLSYLTLVLQPSFGAVRKLYELETKKMVDCQKCLNNDERYIAVGCDQLKYKKNGYLTEKERSHQRVMKSEKQFEDMDSLLNFMTSTKKKKRTVVYVMVSGRQFQVPLKTVLTPEDKGSWKVVLDYLSYLLDVPEGIQHLCTTKGKVVTNPDKLRHGNLYIAVPFVDSFMKMDYRKVFEDYKQGRVPMCDDMLNKKPKNKGKKKYVPNPNSISPSMAVFKGSTPTLQYGKCISVKCSVSECKLFNDSSDNETTFSSTFRSDKGAMSCCTETDVPAVSSREGKKVGSQKSIETAVSSKDGRKVGSQKSIETAVPSKAESLAQEISDEASNAGSPPPAECCKSKMTTFAEIAKTKEQEAALQDKIGNAEVSADEELRPSVTFRSVEQFAQDTITEKSLSESDASSRITTAQVNSILKTSYNSSEPITPPPPLDLLEEESDIDSDERGTQERYDLLRRTSSFNRQTRDSICVNAERLAKISKVIQDLKDGIKKKLSDDNSSQVEELKNSDSSHSKLTCPDIYLNYDFRVSKTESPQESNKLEGEQEKQKKTKEADLPEHSGWTDSQLQNEKGGGKEQTSFEMINLNLKELSTYMNVNNEGGGKCSRITFDFKPNIIEDTRIEPTSDDSTNSSEKTDDSNDYDKFATIIEETHNEHSSNECLKGSGESDNSEDNNKIGTDTENAHNKNGSNDCLSGSEEFVNSNDYKEISNNLSEDSLEKISTNNNNNNKTTNIVSNESLDSLEDKIISTNDNNTNINTHELPESFEKNPTNHDGTKNIGTNESMDSLEGAKITNDNNTNMSTHELTDSLEKNSTNNNGTKNIGTNESMDSLEETINISNNASQTNGRNENLESLEKKTVGTSPFPFWGMKNYCGMFLQPTDLNSQNKNISLNQENEDTNNKSPNIDTNESLDKLENNATSFSNNNKNNLKKMSLDSLEENLSNNSDSNNHADVQENTRQHYGTDKRENKGNSKLDNNTSINIFEKDNSVANRIQDQISPTRSFSSDSLEEEQNVVNTYYIIYSNTNEKTLIFNNNAGIIEDTSGKSSNNYQSFYLNQKETKSKTIFYRKKDESDLEENQIQRSEKVQEHLNAYINHNLRNRYLNRKNNFNDNTKHGILNKNQDTNIINNYYGTIRYEIPNSSLNAGGTDGLYNKLPYKTLRTNKEKNYNSNGISNKHNLLLNNDKTTKSPLNGPIEKRNNGTNNKSTQLYQDQLNYKDFLIVLKMNLNERSTSNDDNINKNNNDNFKKPIIKNKRKEKLNLNIDNQDKSNVLEKSPSAKESVDNSNENINDGNQEIKTSVDNEDCCCENVFQPADLNIQNQNISLDLMEPDINSDVKIQQNIKESLNNCCENVLQPTDDKVEPDINSNGKIQQNIKKSLKNCCENVLQPTDLNIQYENISLNQEVKEEADINSDIKIQQNIKESLNTCCENVSQLTDLNQVDKLEPDTKSLNNLDKTTIDKKINRFSFMGMENYCGIFLQSTDSQNKNISVNQENAKPEKKSDSLDNPNNIRKHPSLEDNLRNLDKTTYNNKKSSTHIFLGRKECCEHIIVNDQTGKPKSIGDKNGNIPEDKANSLKKFETNQKESKSDSSLDSLKENLYDSHSDTIDFSVSRGKPDSIEHRKVKSNILKTKTNNKHMGLETKLADQSKNSKTACSDFCLRCNKKYLREASAVFGCSDYDCTIKCKEGQYNDADDLKNNGVFVGCSNICIKCPQD